jgi:hypothetical protein
MEDQFSEFKEVLEKAVTSSDILDTFEGRMLAECCMEHAAKHAKGSVGKDNIVAVHLYHDEFSFRDYDISEHGKYVSRKQVGILENIIRHVNGGKVSKVLFDDFALYGAMTHKLVEEGFVDKVIFTEESCGKPLDVSDLSGFRGSRKTYIGGTYGTMCVRTAAGEIKKYAPPLSVRPIRDAIVHYEPDIYDMLMAITSAKLLSRGRYAGSF